MIDAFTLFYKLIESTQTADIMYTHFHKSNMDNVVDCSDLLRWRWVQSVSALDKFIHDVVKNGMIEIFHGNRPVTPKYQEFKIGLSTLMTMQTSELVDQVRILEQEIFKQNGHKAFQNPKNISDALSYIWNESHKWQSIAAKMLQPTNESDIKTKLNNICIRRNQIVHEGDCQSEMLPLQRQNIEKEDVDDVILFISNITEAIYECLTPTVGNRLSIAFHVDNPLNEDSSNTLKII
jgi:hypothetical protein